MGGLTWLEVVLLVLPSDRPLELSLDAVVFWVEIRVIVLCFFCFKHPLP